MKNSIIKTFEAFQADQLKSLILDFQTYLIQKKREKTNVYEDNFEKYNVIKQKIIEYDVNKFIYDPHSYGIYISPDNNFIELIKELNQVIIHKITLPIEFDFSVDETRLNLIDFEKGIPESLRGFRIGYKLYKLIVTKFGFITSNKYTTLDAYNIWYYLMLDTDLYCFTSNLESGVIYNKLDNTQIKKILDQLNGKDLIFDDELIQKIIEIYGNVESFKHKN